MGRQDRPYYSVDDGTKLALILFQASSNAGQTIFSVTGSEGAFSMSFLASVRLPVGAPHTAYGLLGFAISPANRHRRGRRQRPRRLGAFFWIRASVTSHHAFGKRLQELGGWRPRNAPIEIAKGAGKEVIIADPRRRTEARHF